MSDSVDGMFNAIKKLAVRIVSEKLVPEPTLVELFVKALPWITGALSAVSVLALPPHYRAALQQRQVGVRRKAPPGSKAPRALRSPAGRRARPRSGPRPSRGG